MEYKNLIKSIRKSLEYYKGVIIIYFIISGVMFSLILLSALISLSISLIFFFTYKVQLIIDVFMVSFIILSILSYIYTNKFFISSQLYIFENKYIKESIYTSIKTINYNNATKIFLIKFILYSISVISLLFPELIIRFISIIISVYFIIPIINIFSYYLYNQYKSSN